MIQKRIAIALSAVLLAAAPTFAQSKVGVVNPIKVLNELAETKDINKAMEGEQATFNSQANDRTAKLKEMEGQRDQLKPDAPQWAELNTKLVNERAQAQAWAQQTKLEQLRKFREQAKRMNEKITLAVKDIAKAKGLDLVIADQKPELSEQQMDQMNPQQVMGVLFGRNVMFTGDNVDLNQEVIAKLDAAYKAK